MSLDSAGSSRFSDRSLPRHSTHGAKRSRAASRASTVDPRLSIIDEDGNPSPLPPTHQTHNRPFSRRFLGEPPRYRDGKEPPQYSLWDITGPKGEKLEDLRNLRNNAYVARRGGWKRICLVAFLVVACIVALAVGLAVGLHKKTNGSTSNPTPAASPTPSAGPFPAGSYTFETFLESTSTNCTSSSASWDCEPSVTYATSPTDSMATFNWIISASDSSSSNFTISSSGDPFAISFSSASLFLHDSGSANERYTFATNVQKVVFPTLSTKCYYNDTQFTATMYTKKQKSNPSNPAGRSASSSASLPATTGGNSAGTYVDWNFAVAATQSIGGGDGVPDCYDTKNGQVTGRVTSGYTAQPAENLCTCTYKNYDL